MPESVVPTPQQIRDLPHNMLQTNVLRPPDCQRNGDFHVGLYPVAVYGTPGAIPRTVNAGNTLIVASSWQSQLSTASA
jgi:hypothetical protein